MDSIVCNSSAWQDRIELVEVLVMTEHPALLAITRRDLFVVKLDSGWKEAIESDLRMVSLSLNKPHPERDLYFKLQDELLNLLKNNSFCQMVQYIFDTALVSCDMVDCVNGPVKLRFILTQNSAAFALFNNLCRINQLTVKGGVNFTFRLFTVNEDKKYFGFWNVYCKDMAPQTVKFETEFARDSVTTSCYFTVEFRKGDIQIHTLDDPNNDLDWFKMKGDTGGKS